MFLIWTGFWLESWRDKKKDTLFYDARRIEYELNKVFHSVKYLRKRVFWYWYNHFIVVLYNTNIYFVYIFYEQEGTYELFIT